VSRVFRRWRLEAIRILTVRDTERLKPAVRFDTMTRMRSCFKVWRNLNAHTSTLKAKVDTYSARNQISIQSRTFSVWRMTLAVMLKNEHIVQQVRPCSLLLTKALLEPLTAALPDIH
jgi:hypothetical protein